MRRVLRYGPPRAKEDLFAQSCHARNLEGLQNRTPKKHEENIWPLGSPAGDLNRFRNVDAMEHSG